MKEKPPRPRFEEVLDFWFRQLSPEDWFNGGEAVDERIRGRFAELHEALLKRVPERWRASARGMLAAVIALDQFPRNIYRGTARAFAADGAALALATEAIARGFDGEFPSAERKFLYMPFQHSEDPAAQERSLELFATLENEQDLSPTPAGTRRSSTASGASRTATRRSGERPRRRKSSFSRSPVRRFEESGIRS